MKKSVIGQNIRWMKYKYDGFWLLCTVMTNNIAKSVFQNVSLAKDLRPTTLTIGGKIFNFASRVLRVTFWNSDFMREIYVKCSYVVRTITYSYQ